MKTLKGYINEDVEVNEDTELVGEITGDVTVGEATFVVTGSVKGTIYANEGSVIDLVGDCEELRADASDVSISGTVYGDVVYRDTYLEIDEKAVINGDVIDENEDGTITRYADYDAEAEVVDSGEESEDDEDEDYYGVDDNDDEDDPYDDPFNDYDE